MTTFTRYKIDLTPKDTAHFWRVDIVAWVIKNGRPGLGEEDLEEATGASDGSRIRAEFSLAITSSQLKDIKRGLSSSETWTKLESIFQKYGPADNAPLFRQVAHQELDARPEMKERLRKFLDEIDGGEHVQDEDDGGSGRYTSVGLLRSLLNNSDPVGFRGKAPAAVAPRGRVNEDGNAHGCGPYVFPDDLSLGRCPENTNGKGRSDSSKGNKDISKCLNCKCHGHTAKECRSRVNNTRKPGDRESKGRSGEGAGMDPDTGAFTQGSSTADPEDGTDVANEPCASPTSARGKPFLKTQLVSVSRLTSKAQHIIFKRDEALIVSDTGEVKLKASRVGAKYYLQELNGSKSTSTTPADFATWHRRLGHIDFRDLYTGYKNHVFRGLKLKEAETMKTPICGICQVIKMPGMPLRQVSQGSTELLEIIHADFCGPMSSLSKGGAGFLVTFTDDASGWSAVYFIKHCSEILRCFKEYAYQVETLLKRKIRNLQSDDDMGRDFDDYLKFKGIARITVPNNPQHIRTLLETAKCLLMQSGLDSSFWAEAVNTACYIRNRCPSSKLNGITPHQKWYGKVPSLKHMHEFGARVTCKSEDSNSETKKGIFLGYSKKSNGYRLWIPDDQQIIASSEVEFEDYEEKSGQSTSAAEKESSSEGETFEKLTVDEESNPREQVGYDIPKFSRFDSRRPDYGFSTGPPKYDKNLHDYLKNRVHYSDDESNEEDDDEEVGEDFDDSEILGEGFNFQDEDDDRGEYTNGGPVSKDEPVKTRTRRAVRSRCFMMNHCYVSGSDFAEMRVIRRNDDGAQSVDGMRAPTIVIRQARRGKNLKE